jgi:hypothetical protein
MTLTDILKNATFVLDEDTYHLLKLPPNAITVSAGILAEVGEPFACLMVDKHEITLVLEAEAYEEYSSRLLGHVVGEFAYSLITLDVALEPTVIGLTALLSRALADANIPIIPLGSFSRDHFLVPQERATDALAALNQLKSRD